MLPIFTVSTRKIRGFLLNASALALIVLLPISR